MTRIPFNRPALEGSELEYIRQAVEGGHASSSGPFARRAAELLVEATGATDVLLTTSCTDALEMAAILLDLEPGDTVIVPSFTFVSSALAFVRTGARVLFCDIEPTTLGLDPVHVERLLDPTVRAVVPVHYAGIACDLEGLEKVLAPWPGVAVIEDNAHGLFATYKERPLGSFGRFATLSFHETKNIVCGEGGALVINDPADADRAHVIYDKGTNRRAFLLGQVDKYSWKDLGASFGLSDLLAAYLCAQLEAREQIQAKREHVFTTYESLLRPHAEELDLQLPTVPGDRTQSFHMFHVLLADRPTRDRVLRRLNERGIQATFHYVPLHSSDGGQRFAARPTDCPVTDDVSGRLLRLPFYNALSDAEIERVVTALIEAVSR